MYTPVLVIPSMLGIRYIFKDPEQREEQIPIYHVARNLGWLLVMMRFNFAIS